jgi:hypothetical protein
MSLMSGTILLRNVSIDILAGRYYTTSTAVRQVRQEDSLFPSLIKSIEDVLYALRM